MRRFLSLVKFSHTIFALPFALVGFFLSTLVVEAGFSWQTLGLVILCMVFARNAAMAFNRWLDRDIDAKNPRTQGREIPAGIISARSALGFVLLNCLLFVVTTYFINLRCFYLSPVALAVVLGYSYTKRFTALCHLVLGLGLSLAPLGAYLAGGGGFDAIPLLLAGAVLFWVAGFDVIYALQDEGFDDSLSLHSIPVHFGKKRALNVSQLLHFLSAGLLIMAVVLSRSAFPEFEWLAAGGALLFVGLLIYQHSLVKADDLSKVNLAFFTTNGIASVLFAVFYILDIYF